MGALSAPLLSLESREITQLTLGLLIPLMLCTHLIGERLGVSLYGLHRTYAFALYNFWVARPDLGVMQATLVLVAWIHGCIGLYFWLRLRSFFWRAAPLLLGLAVLLPALGLLGFYQQGRVVRSLAQEPAWRADVLAPDAVGTAAERTNLVRIRDGFLWFYAGAIGFVFAARGIRVLNERRRGIVRLSYPGRTIRVPKGLSVLEASYRHRVPHANVCGGKGRCSTCGFGLSATAPGCRRRLRVKRSCSNGSVRPPIRPCALPASCGRRQTLHSSPSCRRRSRRFCAAGRACIPAKNAIW